MVTNLPLVWPGVCRRNQWEVLRVPLYSHTLLVSVWWQYGAVRTDTADHLEKQRIFSFKTVSRNTDLTQQIRTVLLDCSYCTDCIHFKTVCIFFYFISRETMRLCHFKSGLMEPRMSFFEGYARVHIFLLCTNGVIFLNILFTQITKKMAGACYICFWKENIFIFLNVHAYYILIGAG